MPVYVLAFAVIAYRHIALGFGVWHNLHRYLGLPHSQFPKLVYHLQSAISLPTRQATPCRFVLADLAVIIQASQI